MVQDYDKLVTIEITERKEPSLQLVTITYYDIGEIWYDDIGWPISQLAVAVFNINKTF